MANEYNDWYGMILSGDSGKQKSVEQAKQDKLRKLSDEKRYKLDNSQKIQTFTDADTLITKGTYDEEATVHRMAGGVDTAETSHGNLPTSAKQQARISAQKPRVAEALGIPVTQVTNQDVLDFGEKEKVRAMVEATTGKAYNEDFELYGKVDGSGYNVPVDVQSHGQDDYGRMLSSFKAKGTDFNLNQSALDRGAINPEAVRRGTVGENLTGENVDVATRARQLLSQEMKEQSDFNVDKAFNRDSAPIEVAKGAASMFATGVTDIADLAADVTTWAAQKIGDITGMDEVSDEALANWGVKRREDGSLNSVVFEDAKETLNGYLDYDEKFVTADREEAVQDIKDIFNDDNLSVADKVLSIGEATVKHSGIIPGLVADSAAYLALLGFGGGTSLAGATLKEGSVAAKTAGLFGNVAAKESKVAVAHATAQGTKEGIKAGAKHVANLNKTTRGKNLAGHTRQKYITKKITEVGKRDAVLTAAGLPLAMANSNQALEEWRSNNNGKEPSTAQMAGIVALSTLQTKIDHLADKASFGALKITKDALSKVIKNGTIEGAQGLIKTLSKSIGRGALATAGSTALEGATELTQEAITMYAERFGTEKYKDKDYLSFLDDESQGRLAAAGILGAGGGLGMAGAGAAVQTAKDTRVPLVGKIGNIVSNNSASTKMNRAVNRVENSQNKAASEIVKNTFGDATDTKTPVEAINEALETHDKEFNTKNSDNPLVQDRIISNILTKFVAQAAVQEGGLDKIKEVVEQIKKDPKLGKNFDNVTFSRNIINESLEKIVFDANNNAVGGKKVTEAEILKSFKVIEQIVGSLPLTPEDEAKIEEYKEKAKELLRGYHEKDGKDIDDVSAEFRDIGFLNIQSGTKTRKPVWSHENDIVDDIVLGQNPGHNMKELKNFATSRINKLFNKRYQEGKNHTDEFLEVVIAENEILNKTISKIESAIESMDENDAKTKYQEQIKDIKERMTVAKEYATKMQTTGDEIKRTDKFASKRQKNFGRASNTTVPNENVEGEPETTIESYEEVVIEEDRTPVSTQSPEQLAELQAQVKSFNAFKTTTIQAGTNAYTFFFSKVDAKKKDGSSNGKKIRLTGYMKIDNRGTVSVQKIPMKENGSYSFFPSSVFYEMANNVGKAEDYIFHIKDPKSTGKDTAEKQFVLIDGMVYHGATHRTESGTKEFGYIPLASLNYINKAISEFNETGKVPKNIKNDFIISMLKHDKLFEFAEFINESETVEGYKGKKQVIHTKDLYSQLFAAKNNTEQQEAPTLRKAVQTAVDYVNGLKDNVKKEGLEKLLKRIETLGKAKENTKDEKSALRAIYQVVLNKIKAKTPTEEEVVEEEKSILEPSDSKTATKKSFKVNARILTKNEMIETIIDGEVETQKQGKKGDYVLTGPKGEEYTVEPSKIKERYNEISKKGNSVVLETKPVNIKYTIANKDINFTASWGEKMIANKGDALVYENGKLSYRIEKDIFSETYDSFTEQEPQNEEENPNLEITKNWFVKLNMEKDIPDIASEDKEGFADKEEYHITLISGPLSALIRESSKEVQEKIRQIILKADLSYEDSGKLIKIKKDYPKSKWQEAHTRESIIKPLNMIGLNLMLRKINVLLDNENIAPYPHVTLMTKGSKDGIGIQNEKDFDSLEKEELNQEPEIEVITTTEYKGYSIKEKDGDFDIYTPDGEKVGSFITEGAAKGGITRHIKKTSTVEEEVVTEEVPEEDNTQETVDEMIETYDVVDGYGGRSSFVSEEHYSAIEDRLELADKVKSLKAQSKKLWDDLKVNTRKVLSTELAPYYYSEMFDDIIAIKEALVKDPKANVEIEKASLYDTLYFMPKADSKDVKKAVGALNNIKSSKNLIKIIKEEFEPLLAEKIKESSAVEVKEKTSALKKDADLFYEAKQETDRKLEEAKTKLKAVRTVEHNEARGGTLNNRIYKGMDNEQRRLFTPSKVQDYAISIFDKYVKPITGGHTIQELFDVLPKNKQKTMENPEVIKRFIGSHKILNEMLLLLNTSNIVNNSQFAGYANKDGYLDVNGFKIDEDNIVGSNKNASASKLNALSFIAKHGKMDGAQKENAESFKLDETTTEIIGFYALKMFNDAYELSQTTKDEDIINMFGFGEEADAIDIAIAMSKIREGVIPRSALISSIGKDIYSALGLNSNPEIDNDIEEMLVSQLGMMAANVLMDSGLLNAQEEKMEFEIGNIKRYPDGFRFNTFRTNQEKGSKAHIQYNKDKQSDLRTAISDFSHLIPNERQNVVSETPIEQVSQTVRNSPLYSTSEKAQEKMAENQKQEWRYNALVGFMKDIKNGTEQGMSNLLKMAGWKELSELHPMDIESQESVNRQIENDFEDMFNTYDAFGEDKGMFLKWDFTKSGRFMIDGNINPQGSKLFRFVMQIIGDGKNEGMRNTFNPDKDKDNLDLFKLAVAQALDLDLDKKSDKTVLEKLDKVIIFGKNRKITFNTKIEKNDSKELKKLKELSASLEQSINYINGGKTTVDGHLQGQDALVKLANEGEHIHAVQAAYEIARLMETKDGDFETSLMIEADAITSGMALTLLQIGSKKSQELLQKTGIYTDEVLAKLITKYRKENKDNRAKKNVDPTIVAAIERYNKKHGTKIKPMNITHGILNEQEWFEDFYTDVGMNVMRKSNEYVEIIEKFAKTPTKKGKPRGVGGDGALGIILHSIVNKNYLNDLGEYVQGKVRKIAKDPVMVFIYGSSIGSIRKKLGHTIGRDNLKAMILDEDMKHFKYEDMIRPFVSMNREGDKDWGTFNIGKNISYDALMDFGYKTLYKGMTKAQFDLINQNKEMQDFAEKYVKLSLTLYLTSKQDIRGADGEFYTQEGKPKFAQYVNGELRYENIYAKNKSDRFEPEHTLGNLVITDDMVKNLQLGVNIIHGDAFEAVFEETFGEANLYRDAVKMVEVMTYAIYSNRMDKAIKEVANGKEFLTKKQMRTAITKVIESGMGHNMPTVDGELQGLEKYSDSSSSRTVSGSRSDTSKINEMVRKYVDVMFSEGDYHAKDTGGMEEKIANKQTEDNVRAAPTISIHAIDGASITDSLIGMGALNIYDAFGGSINMNQYDEITDNYQDSIMTNSMSHSVLGSNLEKLNTMLSSLSNKEVKEILDTANYAELFGSLQTMSNKAFEKDEGIFYRSNPEKKLLDAIEMVIEGRKEIFGSNTSSNHIYAVDKNLKDFSGNSNDIAVPAETTKNSLVYKFINNLMNNLEQHVKETEDKKAKHTIKREKDIAEIVNKGKEQKEETVEKEKPKQADLKKEDTRMYIAGKVKDFALNKTKNKLIATKDAMKASIANKFIGFGAQGTSTNAYKNLYNSPNFKAANLSEYNKDDIVFVSVNGSNSKKRIKPTRTVKGKLALAGGYMNIEKALNAGATIVVDSQEYIDSSTYNTGENELRNYFVQEGYNYEEESITIGEEKISVGKWTKGKPKKDKKGSLENRDDSKDETVDEIEFDVATRLESELLTYMEMEGYINEDEGGALQLSGKDKKYAAHLTGLAQNLIEIVKDAKLDIGVRVNRFYTEGRTRGSADIVRNHIDLRFNTDGDTMFGATDTFMHEVLHILTNHAMELKPGIRAKIRDVQEQVRKEVTYTAFLPKDKQWTSEDIAIANELYEYVLEGDEAEFVSYSMTNPFFYEAIADIEVQSDILNNLKSQSSFATVMNKFIDIINKVYSAVIGLKSRKAQEAMRNLTEELATVQADRLAETIEEQEENAEKGIFKGAFDAIDKKMLKHNDKINGKLAEIAKKADIKLRTSTLLERVSEIKGLQRIKQTQFFQDIYSEITESTSDESVYGAYKLFNKVKKIQETDKEKLRTSLEVNIGEMVEGTTDEQRKGIKRVLLDTDVTTLSKKKGFGLPAVERLLRDEKYLDSEIKRIRGLFGSTQDDFDYMEQAEGLGYYMVNGESPVLNQMKNANNIYRKLYKGEKHIIRGELEENGIIENIDILATLYGIKYSGKENKELAASALDTNEAGIKTMLNTFAMHMKEYNDELFETVGRFSDVDNKAKGYTYGSYRENKKMVIVKEEDIKYFEYMKMKVVKEVDEFLGEDITEKRYVMVGDNIDATYNKGMMDIIGFGSTGLTLREMAQQSGQAEEEVLDTINAMKTSNSGHRATGKELNINPKKMTMKLLPKFDLGGHIVDYASEMNHLDKVQYMTLNDDVVDTIANTVTNTSAKHSAIHSNTKVIDYLLNDAERNYKDNPDDFIVIEPSRPRDGYISPTEKQWAIIPQYTKDYLANKTNGGKQLIVRKRLVNDVFGYRSPSLANIGNMKEKHPRFYRAVRVLEKFWMSVVSKFKGIIVTMTSPVVFGNMVSNMFFAAQHGVDPLTFARDSIEAWKLLDIYSADQRELSKLHILEKGGEKVSQSRIRGLEKKLKKNPISEFVERGMFSPIVEDINVNERREHSDVDRFIDKMSSKVPGPIAGFLDFIYVNEGTLIHRTMFKMIQYGDITARYSIKKKLEKDGKMTEDEQWGYLDELLVNYGYNENKYLRYFNDVGALMFTKYFLRTPKAIIRMMKNNPTMSTIFQGVQYGTGIDVVDPLDTFVDPIGAILNRIGNPIDMGYEIITPNISNLLFDFGDFVDFK